MPMEQFNAVACLHGLVQLVGGLKRSPVQALGAGQIEIGFVDRGHLDLRREALQDFVNLVRVFDVALAVAVDEDRLGAEFVGGPQGHGRVDSELAGRVRCRRDHAALIGPPADDHRFAFERGIEQLLDGDEERVHVEMEVELHRPSSAGSPAADPPGRSGFPLPSTRPAYRSRRRPRRSRFPSPASRRAASNRSASGIRRR